MSKPFEYGTEFFVTQDLYNNNFKFFDQLVNKKIKITHKECGAKLGYFVGMTWKAEAIPAVRASQYPHLNGDPYLNRDVETGRISDGYDIGPPFYFNNNLSYGSTVSIYDRQILGDVYYPSKNYMFMRDSYYNDYIPVDMYNKIGLSLNQAIKSRLYYIDIYYFLRDVSTGKEYQLECDYRDQVHISILSDNPNDFGKAKSL
jgi:hypothetical protein